MRLWYDKELDEVYSFEELRQRWESSQVETPFDEWFEVVSYMQLEEIKNNEEVVK